MADGSHQSDDGLLEGAPRLNPRGALQKWLLAVCVCYITAMKEIKLRIPEDDLAMLEIEAKAEKTSRAELIRSRLRTSSKSSSLTLDDFQRLITKVVRTSGVALPRPQVETLVATVVAELNR